MAGDPHLPRALTVVLGALLAALAAGCADSQHTRLRADDRPAAPAAPAAAGKPQLSDRLASDEALDAAVEKAAWARLRWPQGDVIDARRPQRLDEPVLAGSIAKLVAARAAMTSAPHLIAARFVCPRRIETHGRRVDCVHPDLGRPLSLGDAIAHSCNNYFVRLAERLDASAVAATLRRLSGGASPAVIDAPLPLVVLGLDGPRLSMRTWLRVALAAMTGHDAAGAADPGASQSLAGPMARAVSDGSASALAADALLTFAKTGTAIAATGQQEGLLVAWRPEIDEAIVVRVAGGAGRDAARVARAVWDRADAARQRIVRVGRVREASVPVRVDDMPIEAYTARVVAAEGEATLLPAALEALAVLARSYAASPDGRHAREGFDVCDTTHCQVIGRPTPWSQAAARVTHGTVLSHGGRLVAVPYSASCSGTLVAAADVWGGGGAVVTTIGPDPGTHDIETWTSEVTADALTSVLRAAGHTGSQLRDVRVVTATAAGLPTRIALDGLHPDTIDATTFRHLVGRDLGWDVLKSHVWTLARTARGYRFSGRGKGHGVGLCVRGAAVLASRGTSSGDVLRAYVPGATLTSLEDVVTARVPAAFTAAIPDLQRTVRSTLAELRRTLLVHTPRTVDVVVHPTHAAYQRATRRAWWTAASTREVTGGHYRIDMAPPPAAGDISGLQATMRHELVHVLTHAALDRAPAWAAEGLATLLARPAGIAASPGTSGPVPPAICPADDEVTRPGGAEAMRLAYLDAAGCVAGAVHGDVGQWRRLATSPAPSGTSGSVYGK